MQVTVFPMAEAVGAAREGQKTPDGYNVERMVKRRTVGRNRALPCGTCTAARGFFEADLDA